MMTTNFNHNTSLMSIFTYHFCIIRSRFFRFFIFYHFDSQHKTYTPGFTNNRRFPFNLF